MSIPNNITKDHLLLAISKIDQEGIPNDGLSRFYDVIFNGKKYPPKLILSYANIFANGKILDRNSFEGGHDSECFKILKENKFMIIEKNNEDSKKTKVWFVTQGSTFKAERGMKFIWAPSKGKDNKPRFYWDNVLKVKKGDIIFNYSDGIKGVSIATTDGYRFDNDDPSSNWRNEGYRADINLIPLKPPIPVSKIASKRAEFDRCLSSINFKPFNRSGGVNQGYLYEFNKEAGKLVKDIYEKPFGNDIIDSFFDNIVVQQEQEILESKMNYINEYLRETLAIRTKPFIILAGLSGTGKSRLVRTLAYRFNNIDSDRRDQIHPPTNFCLIKVKPNWHDSSDLLGYESRISGKDRFIVTDFVRFIVKAWQNPETPFFICLDEMNLAPVEQYFAEYLSVIESRRQSNLGIIRTDKIISSSLIRKYANKTSGVDERYELWDDLDLADISLKEELKSNGLTLPQNLIVMGTVNVDETTHSFSRKVLDRAMTIEMNEIDLFQGLDENNDDWNYPDAPYESSFVFSQKTQGSEVYIKLGIYGETIIDYLNQINEKLEGSAFRIAYRVRDEFLLYAYNYSLISNKSDDWLKQVLDEMTLMKILPRIEGDSDRTKLLDDLRLLFETENLPKSLRKTIEMVNKREISHYTSFWS